MNSLPDRDQRGFSMFVVIMALFVTSMFVAAAFAAANGDLPMGGNFKDRKQTYAAAEAGLNFYLTHLGEDPDYWINCENVPAPGPGQPNPVSKYWDGTGTDKRTWRTVPGSTAQYTVEIIPPTSTPCTAGVNSTAIDKTGVLRIRATGRPSPTSPMRRSIIANLRRNGFLDFLYYTNYEDGDPQSLSTQDARDNAQANCIKYRWDRGSACSADEIQFITGDSVNGPLHSNDSLLICNTPVFGRTPDDKIELVPKTNDTVAASGCTNSPKFNGVHISGAAKMDPPATNDALRKAALDGGYVFKGKTIIRLDDNDKMTVFNNGSKTVKDWPPNGVIYVDPNGGTCAPQYPARVAYDADTDGDGVADDQGCGNVWVSGTYKSSLTIGAANDIVIGPTTDNGTIDWTRTDENLLKDGDPVLGLIANNFVRVGHKVATTTDSRGRESSCSNASSFKDGQSTPKDGVTIEAAILSLQHSFIVDNYNCGSALGKLNVNGAIAQNFRGPVGTGSGTTGFLKNYNYDDRLRYRSPPYFLTPVDSQWKVIRSNEQVGAK